MKKLKNRLPSARKTLTKYVFWEQWRFLNPVQSIRAVKILVAVAVQLAN